MLKNILIHQTTVKKRPYLCPKLKKTNGKRSPHGAVAHISRDTIINSHRAIWQNFIFGDMKKLLLMMVLGMLAVGGMEAQNESGSNTATSGSIPTSALRAEGNYWTLDQAAESYAGGTGTEADPYLIATPAQFIKLCYETYDSEGKGELFYEGKYFKQTADIDLSAAYSTLLRIGLGGYFAGTYDGGNFVIKGFRQNETNTNEVKGSVMGISPFANVKDATIKNVIIEDFEAEFTYPNLYEASINGGMLVYYATNTTIENCKVSGDIKLDAAGESCGLFIGGIAGIANNSTINKCHADGTIDLKMNLTGVTTPSESYSSAAGISSEIIDQTYILNTTSDVDIKNETKGDTDYALCTRVAGVTTWTSDGVFINNCSNTGSLSAWGSNTTVETNFVQVGGLISYFGGGRLNNCWNACKFVSVRNGQMWDFKGLVYDFAGLGMNNCFYDAEFCEIYVTEDLPGSLGADTEYMQSKEFVMQLNSQLQEGWLPWQYVEGSYPVLGEASTEDPTASESISKSEIAFRTVPGAVVITAPEATQFAAYTFTGAMQATQLIPAGTTTVNLPAGLYILKIGEETHKVNVK